MLLLESFAVMFIKFAFCSYSTLPKLVSVTRLVTLLKVLPTMA